MSNYWTPRRKPPRTKTGDHVRIGRVVHLVKFSMAGPNGGYAWIKNRRTACNSHRFHDLAREKTEDGITCLECLAEET